MMGIFHLGGAMKLGLSMVALVSAISTVASGQAPVEQNASLPRGSAMTGAAARVGASCDYDTCALRFKPTVWQWEIVKGSDGKSVGSLGGLRTPNIAALMADVPEAAQQARAGQRRYLRSSVMIWGGTIASVAGLAFYYGSEMHTTGNIVGYTGLAALFIGGYERAVSLELLSKSMWLYNRALRR